MDDWVILAKTRWALRRVVQQVNTILDNFIDTCGSVLPDRRDVVHNLLL